jgi:predicted unusual protein kinase regulating ubiquinone biosynthesis (AarF/ABC1/UbiB family)
VERPPDQTDADEHPPPNAAEPPTSGIGRTARIGGLVTSQGLRWAGMRAVNRVRSPERAQAAEEERTVALIGELVDRLGQMRGAAMKVGQMISMVEFENLPDAQAQELQRKLATLRDDVPPVPFAQIENLISKELGGSLHTFFSEFDEHAFAAASIGQVHRARTLNGQEVAVKVQYPGIAEAVDTDLRNAILLIPLIKRLAPGLDTKGMAAEMTERIREELDYELEAQNQRRIERLMRGHPRVQVPRVHTDLSSRRVLVSDYVEGARFEALRQAAQPDRDAAAETVFRFFFGLAYRDRIVLGDPHPGNYLWHAEGPVTFLDFGLMRKVSAERVRAEAAIAQAVREQNQAMLKQALIAGGYLPKQRADAVEEKFALRMMSQAISWYAVPGSRALDARERHHPERERASAEQREAARRQVNQFTVPAEAMLIRRMHGVVGTVLLGLRAEADWGAIAAEYLHGEPPATEQGRQEAEFLAGRTVGAG